MVKASSSSGKSSGQHFVPASLLPYGGFGDPATPVPFWKPPRSISADKLALSQAQDRFMRAVRVYLLSVDKSDDDFESELGYRRYGLTRKMNGQEAMTMRDLLRICEEVPGALVALIDSDVASDWVAEPQAKFRKAKADPTIVGFHSAIQDAVDALQEAAGSVEKSNYDKSEGFGAVLRSLSQVANDIGAALAKRQRSGKGKGRKP